MMTTAEHQVLRVSADVVSRSLDGEAVLLDIAQGTYFGLNEVGTLIWESIVEGCTFGGLRTRVLDAYEVDADALTRDLEAFVDKLRARGLVTIEG